jgi:hypothetical protein
VNVGTIPRTERNLKRQIERKRTRAREEKSRAHDREERDSASRKSARGRHEQKSDHEDETRKRSGLGVEAHKEHDSENSFDRAESERIRFSSCDMRIAHVCERCGDGDADEKCGEGGEEEEFRK